MKLIPTSQPITCAKQDLLGRSNIVTAITNKIIDRSKNDIHCEVIGVYGKWGEGKSSILNLVKEQLKPSSKDEKDKTNNPIKINIIDFNPWLFQDQESMLMDFFDKFKKDFSSRNIRRAINKYSKLVSSSVEILILRKYPFLIGFFRGMMSSLLRMCTKNKDIQKLKTKLNNDIRKETKHIIIFIDDVDRLDKDELHTLFKLIKQNADFVNTTYVIAMDVEMVANSISHRFEDGNKDAGHNFLEKIIQYPIYIPKPQQSKMEEIFSGLIVSEFEKLGTNDNALNKMEYDRIKENLIENIFPLFDTVREMMLYKNSISFILPSVYKDINLSDFAMLEALKQFHIKGYELIKQNRYLLTGAEFLSPENILDDNATKEEKKNKRFNDFKNRLLQDVNPRKYFTLSILISNLIQLERNLSTYDCDNKRLCSSKYFDNYFMYDNRDNNIPSEEIEELSKLLPTISDEDMLFKMERIMSRYGYDELKYLILQSLNTATIRNLNLSIIEKICFSLSNLAINKNRSIQRHANDILTETAIVLIIFDYSNALALLENKRYDVDGAITILERIISVENLYPYHVFLISSFINHHSIKIQNISRLDQILYDFTLKYIKQHGLEKLFEFSMWHFKNIFRSWKAINKTEYIENINKYMLSDSFEIIPFVRRTIKVEYNGNIENKTTDDSFNEFSSLFDVEKLISKLDEEEIFLDDDDSESRRSVEYFKERYRILQRN